MSVVIFEEVRSSDPPVRIINTSDISVIETNSRIKTIGQPTLVIVQMKTGYKFSVRLSDYPSTQSPQSVIQAICEMMIEKRESLQRFYCEWI